MVLSTFWASIGHLLGIFKASFGHLLGISWASFGNLLVMLDVQKDAQIDFAEMTILGLGLAKYVTMSHVKKSSEEPQWRKTYSGRGIVNHVTKS